MELFKTFAASEFGQLTIMAGCVIVMIAGAAFAITGGGDPDASVTLYTLLSEN